MSDAPQTRRVPPALATVLFAALSLATSLALSQPPAPPGAAPDPPTTPLLRQMEALEAAMSDAFNRCDIETLETFYDPRLEFYHDGAGVTWTREQFIGNVQKNACNRFRRHMVPGTMEAWPLGNFGALYTGRYQACTPGKEAGVVTEKCVVQGKVVMILQNQAGRWVITRVVSYDHRELP